MSAVDEIQEALDLLLSLATESTQGRWQYVAQGALGLATESSEEILDSPLIQVKKNEEDGLLIEVLHSTINVQIAILQETLFQLSGSPHARGFIGNEFTLFARLASAINGQAS